jgi:hypothetical protein
VCYHLGEDAEPKNSLALRGLEEPAHALHGLEELFFQLCCCVVSVFGSGGKCGNSLSSGCAIIITTGKKVLVVCLVGARLLLRPEKKVLVVCLAGARSLLRPEKKSSTRLSGGCAIIVMTGKKIY